MSYVIRYRRGEAAVEIRWDGSPHVIGRDPACDLVVDCDGVSRRHVRIGASAAGICVEDLQSANGTWTGMSPIRSSVLRVPCQLRLGPDFTLSISQSADDGHASNPERRLRVAVWLVGILALLGILLLQESTTRSERSNVVYGEIARALPPLPDVDNDALFGWALAKAADGGFHPGAYGLALRGFRQVAASDATVAVDAAAHATRIAETLKLKLDRLTFEAERALAARDWRAVGLTATALRREALTFDLQKVELAEQLLGRSANGRR